MTPLRHLEVVDARTWDVERLLSYLSADERAASSRIGLRSHRSGYLGAHVRLRQVLAETVQTPPAALRFARARCPRCGGGRGRPRLDLPGAPAVHFSISHSDWLAAVAVAEVPVGVDVQVLRPGFPGVLSQLDPLERAQIGPSPERLARCWTRKEAVLKAVGVGIAHGIREPHVGAAERPHQPPGFRVTDIEVPDGFCGAVAIATTAPDGPIGERNSDG